MLSLKIIGLVLLCIFASTDAKKKNNRNVSVTVQGTLLLNVPKNIPEPNFVVVQIKVNNQEPKFETRIHWNQCKSGKCRYVVRHINGNVGQRFAVGVSLYYNADGDHAGSPTKLAWSKEIGEIKAEGTTQQIKYDADGQYPRVSLIDSLENQTSGSQVHQISGAFEHVPAAPVTSSTGEKVSVTVEGTVMVDLAGNPEPDHLIVYLKLNGEHEQYSNAKRVQWSLCPDHKCPYAMRPVTGHTGQTYALGCMLYYKKSPWNTPKIIWSKEVSVLKSGENKQDAEFDSKLVTLLNVSNDTTHQPVPEKVADQNRPVAVKESVSTHNQTVIVHGSSYSSQRQSVTVSGSPGRAILVDIGVTLHINLANNHLLMPNTVSIKLKLDGERTQFGMIRRAYNYVKRILTGRGANYETTARWEHCHGNKCRYAIRKVHGYVDQSYAVGVKLNYKSKAQGYPTDFVWSTEVGVLKEGKNEIELMYDTAHQTVTLLNSSNAATNTQPQPSNTISNKSAQVMPDYGNRNGKKTKGKVTIHGTIHLELPLNRMQKPDDFVIYVETDDREVYLLQIGSDCTNSKCQYSIPDVNAYVGQKYNLGMSLFYSAFSKNVGKAYKIAWLKDVHVSKDGENKLDIKYDTITVTALN